ncbi:DNA circularization N-terminal domain-containing protein [Gallibacterium salpingitidis]|uniref:DNA circularization protein n=1 Tax=Gallibacterium salpingitidis TaxID=505341 RepID=UPI00266F6AEF|nr:DNA circularization N-terminal domain-containing protein [Gallibacterium salpingitidis]WKS99795.1 DNA circularization N-terminal domain-containing protein [Gallibacterium salpingitidis]
MANITGKGSFAGVPFLIEEGQSIDGGRRLVKHEYPLKDEGLTEDLGKKLRSYNVACLVIGDNHIKQAEKLIDALEKGVGELKHPYFGTVEVCVESYKAQYSTSHQRVTRFDITFTPAVEKNAPEVAHNTAFAALSDYALALDVIANEFAKIFDEIEGYLSLITDNPIIDMANAILAFVDNVFDQINNVTVGVQSIKARINAIKSLFTTTRTTTSHQATAKLLQSLVAINVPLSKDYVTLNNVLMFALEQAKPDAAESTLNTFAKAVNTKATTSLSNQQMLPLRSQALYDGIMVKMQFVLVRLMQATLAIEIGTALSQAVTTSLVRAQSLAETEAQDVSKQQTLVESKADIMRYLAEIDEQLETVIIDNADAQQWQSYQALEQFRQTLITDLRVRGEQLANAKSVQLSDTYPAIVVEYQHTANAKTWRRLVLRNGIRHPLFCIGGNKIEVLQ